MRELSDEELCSRIRGYCLRVRGGHTAEVSVTEGKPFVTKDGRYFATRAIVSNMLWGLPPNVSSRDIPRGRGAR